MVGNYFGEISMSRYNHVLSDPESLSDNLTHNSPVHNEPTSPRWTMVIAVSLVILSAFLGALYFLI